MQNNSSSNGGVEFVGLLTIAFIALKLTGYIGWSWWWVISPIWIPVTLAVAFFLIVFLIVFMIAAIITFFQG